MLGANRAEAPSSETSSARELGVDPAEAGAVNRLLASGPARLAAALPAGHESQQEGHAHTKRPWWEEVHSPPTSQLQGASTVLHTSHPAPPGDGVTVSLSPGDPSTGPVKSRASLLAKVLWPSLRGCDSSSNLTLSTSRTSCQ